MARARRDVRRRRHLSRVCARQQSPSHLRARRGSDRLPPLLDPCGGSTPAELLGLLPDDQSLPPHPAIAGDGAVQRDEASSMRRYALRFNRRYERDAHLFRNRFGAVLQETQEQMLVERAVRSLGTLSRSSCVARPEEWRWSEPPCRGRARLAAHIPRRATTTQPALRRARKGHGPDTGRSSPVDSGEPGV